MVRSLFDFIYNRHSVVSSNTFFCIARPLSSRIDAKHRKVSQYANFRL